jgi:hypothetical protein
MIRLFKSSRFHRLVRWGLGIHGTIHIVEFVLNLYEGAWMSAIFTLLAGLLMISGALIDASHHSENSCKNKT